MQRIFKGRPPRLAMVFQNQETPLYFITINTLHRARTLANQTILDALIDYAERNASAGRAIGRFVIMPDHIHLFVCINEGDNLSTFMRLLKQKLSVALKAETGQKLEWQPGFFDHLIRSSESYHEKWIYVRDNPVRQHLVASADDWPWQGEVIEIQRR